MTKSDIVGRICEAADVNRATATAALDAALAAISDALKAGENVQLVGFGTFAVNKRAARTGRNPRTGEELKIAASNVPVFKAGKGLKDAVN